ncbi:MAG: lycopene cyclase domain-containing protein [Candidatus Omnitrophica bacterium]|nr:lycopene cyclase domain-containing protein [Candidatus Omnitrophota bacterium]
MKEYTLMASLSVVAIIFADHFSRIRLLRRKEFYVLLAVIFLFKLAVNGYLTRNIVKYNPEFFLGIRVLSIPIEDFLFGFSMITLTLIFWERYKKQLNIYK